MSIIVNLRYGNETTEVRCQRLNPDPLIEGNLLIEGVASLELRLMNGDRMLPHTMSVPRASVAGYYGGELVTVEGSRGGDGGVPEGSVEEKGCRG